MLRPPTPEAVDRLIDAATCDDLTLDRALTVLGILPPLDLDPIRGWLSMPGAVLVAGTNPDGHRLLTVMSHDRPHAWIHHDGRVVTADHELSAA